MGAAGQLDTTSARSVQSHGWPAALLLGNSAISIHSREVASMAGNDEYLEKLPTIPSRSNRWHTRITTDKPAILAFLERDRFYAAYAIGDLAPGMFEQSTWAVAEEAGRVQALVLHFHGLTPPALFLMGAHDGLSAILKHSLCPSPVYVTCRSEHLPLTQALYDWHDTIVMWRMVLRPPRFRPVARACKELCSADAAQLSALYTLGGGDAFTLAQLRHGVFYGVIVDHRIVAVAGTHLVSPEYGVAAVGNVFTHPAHRGQGFATAVTSAVVSSLLRAGIRDIVLNVSQTNRSALDVYEKLGFERYCSFLEGPATLGAGQAGPCQEGDTMAYDKTLAHRIRCLLVSQPGLTEREMFGGIGFMLHGNMACGVNRDKLIVRVGPIRYEESLAQPHSGVFDMGGRPKKGCITVSPEGYASDDDLQEWLERGVGFAKTLPHKS
jgi:RimJ/RimL family protein N-acetyltransferase